MTPIESEPTSGVALQHPWRGAWSCGDSQQHAEPPAGNHQPDRQENRSWAVSGATNWSYRLVRHLGAIWDIQVISPRGHGSFQLIFPTEGTLEMAKTPDKKTSPKVATKASKALQDPKSTPAEKSVAASDLSQAGAKKKKQ